jgi:hypothetical protein
MKELIEQYKNLIIEFNPSITKIEVDDEWSYKKEIKTRLSKFNGFSSAEEYKFGLSKFEREFISVQNKNHEFHDTLLYLKNTCNYILTYLHFDNNEYNPNYYHSEMPKGFHDSIEDNKYDIDSFIEQSYKSVQRILDFIEDTLRYSPTTKTKSTKKVQNNEVAKIGFLESQTKFNQPKIDKIYKVLSELELIKCDKRTFNYWFRFSPEKQNQDNPKIKWVGGKNSLSYFIRTVIVYNNSSKSKNEGKWHHANNVFEHTDKNGENIDISSLISDRSGTPKQTIKVKIDSLKTL